MEIEPSMNFSQLYPVLKVTTHKWFSAMMFIGVILSCSKDHQGVQDLLNVSFLLKEVLVLKNH
jgi:hypothetical protein